MELILCGSEPRGGSGKGSALNISRTSLTSLINSKLRERADQASSISVTPSLVPAECSKFVNRESTVAAPTIALTMSVSLPCSFRSKYRTTSLLAALTDKATSSSRFDSVAMSSCDSSAATDETTVSMYVRRVFVTSLIASTWVARFCNCVCSDLLVKYSRKSPAHCSRNQLSISSKRENSRTGLFRGLLKILSMRENTSAESTYAYWTSVFSRLSLKVPYSPYTEASINTYIGMSASTAASNSLSVMEE